MVVGVYLFRNNALLRGSQGLRMLETVKNSCWSQFGLEIQVSAHLNGSPISVSLCSEHALRHVPPIVW